MRMKKTVLGLVAALLTLSSCGSFYAVQKSADYEYRYEEAKACFARGQYSKAGQLLMDLVTTFKGTQYAEESLYMLAMAEFQNHDYETASGYFKKYYESYPRGLYVEYARYYNGLSLYKQTPDSRLDQSATAGALKSFQDFLDYYPYTTLKDKTHEMIYTLQDKLVDKEYMAAKLYYDLGSYVGNCTSGGSNYEACVVTAENCLKDYPYARPQKREELSRLVLLAKYHLAKQSVDAKRDDRFREAIDEYYAFVNDYPESKYLKEAKSVFKEADAYVKKQKIEINEH